MLTKATPKTANMSDHTIPAPFFFDELTSTNSKLRELMITGHLAPYSVVQAAFQTAGRGQEGNRWESARGENLLFSILIKPHQLLAHHQFYLSKAISIAIIESLNDLTPGFRIKWPNDIYYGDKKVAGILIENNLYQEYIGSSIAGIGININQTKFISDAPNPVSIKQITNRDQAISDLLDNITQTMVWWIDKLDKRNLAEIDSHYRHNLYRSKGVYGFVDQTGYFEAELEDIEPEGYLVLRDTQNQIRSYAFKEVSYVIN